MFKNIKTGERAYKMTIMILLSCTIIKIFSRILFLNWVFLHLQDVVLMRALRDMNLPKFVFEDVPLFLGLISDLFPGLDCPRVRYPNFNDAVEQILQENNYVILPNQVCFLYLTSYL